MVTKNGIEMTDETVIDITQLRFTAQQLALFIQLPKSFKYSNRESPVLLFQLHVYYFTRYNVN